jgi:cytochrome c oxidase cbb3-type subunit 3
MSKAEDDRLLDHSYDGIQEYDNPLPGWWRTAFWATIVFAFGYVIWFDTLNMGQTPAEAYHAARVEYDAQKGKRDLADAANVSEAILERDSLDPKVVEKGAKVFATRCVACHTENGRGLIGPNLTDEYQLHGSSRLDIFKTIRGGVAGTPMLAWGEQMPPTDVVAVAAFAITLRGKNIAGKPPQGVHVENFK